MVTVLQETHNSRSSRSQLDALDDEDEVVAIKRVSGGDDNLREVRISCPDATGLGCDLTRILFDFGLRILEGDVSTDGKWCFLIFKVLLANGVPARWKLLKSRLEAICPQHATNHTPIWKQRSNVAWQQPFLLQCTSYDRVGVLHDLVHTLWEADVAVFKAHITTSPSLEVLDMFWLYDNRNELPEHHRVLEICDRVKEALRQPDAFVTIERAPLETCEEDSTTNTIIRRCACKDAQPVSPLRKILKTRTFGAGDSVGDESSDSASDMFTEKDEYGQEEPVKISLDNSTSPAYTVVSVVCRDRKGLVYDLMRTLKDIQVRVAYGKIMVVHGDTCEVDLFVQEVEGGRLLDSISQQELVERLRMAVSLPVRISIKDVYDSTCTELLVTANLDSGGRGRPRVTFDVTAALHAAGICVFMADIYIEVPDSSSERRPQELHRFLVHFRDGRPLETDAEKRALYELIRTALTGTTREFPALPMTQPGIA